MPEITKDQIQQLLKWNFYLIVFNVVFLIFNLVMYWYKQNLIYGAFFLLHGGMIVFLADVRGRMYRLDMLLDEIEKIKKLKRQKNTPE